MKFTQYLRPDGRKVEAFVSCSAEVEKRAQEIEALGYRFECEVLNVPPGLQNVSLTITGRQGDVAIELARNGPEVLVAIRKLVMEFKP